MLVATVQCSDWLRVKNAAASDSTFISSADQFTIGH